MSDILPITTGAPPPIRPVDDSAPRPRFSVMLPTHEPDEKLCRTLESVLRQDIAADQMEIVVVDDASTNGLVRRLVRSVDPGDRVEIVENDDRLGLGGNWNRAIAMSRGRLVHLLHQDDYVLPGFYQRLGRAFRAVGVGMAFCRSRIIDGQDCLLKLTSRQQWFPGAIADWLPSIAERQRVQTPAAVVARSTYEAVGGYRSDLCHALDWEMWVRIASRFPVWYEPRPLAAYRRHALNESSRLAAHGKVWPDMARAIGINAGHLPAAMRGKVMAGSVRWHAASALRTAERQIAAGAIDAAASTLFHVPDMLRLIPGDAVASSMLRRIAMLQSRLRRGGRRAA